MNGKSGESDSDKDNISAADRIESLVRYAITGERKINPPVILISGIGAETKSISVVTNEVDCAEIRKD